METPNMDYLDALAGDNREFRERFAGILKSEFPGERQAYEKALQEGDFEEARQMVHKLKHKISILGLKKGYALAENYEEHLREGRDAYPAEFGEILDCMAQFLNEL